MTDKPILLVEDDSNDLELTLMALRKNRIDNKIMVARDGLEALDFLFAQGKYSDRAQRDLPALVLLDLKLPHLSRLEVLQRIRANKTTRVVPVVILTSSTEEKDILESYQFGANGYMREYADFDEFMMMVKRLYEYWLIVNFPPPSDT